MSHRIGRIAGHVVKPPSFQERPGELPAAPSAQLPAGSFGPPWRRGWDANYDGRAAPDGEAAPAQAPVRHVLLIRHGQYHLDTDEQGLTELGRLQSKKTGERLREWAEGVKEDRYGKTKVKISRVVCSDVPRARQSAEIIAAELGMEIAEVDPVLAEGTPCLHFPGAERQLRSTGEARLLRDSARIEYAFRKYCHRSCDLSTPRKMQEVTEAYSGRQVDEKVEKDAAVTYEVVVCHMNVIRYFVLRALQLPPEAWLRLRGDNGGITELIFYPEGKVSLSRFADTGHLGIAEMTFH